MASITSARYLKEWEKRYKNPVYQAKSENVKTFTMYANYLLDMVLSRFKLKGEVPEELKTHLWWIEQNLIFRGCVILFKEEMTGKFFMLPAIPTGYPTIYNDYEKFQAIGANGETFEVKRENCAVLYDSINHDQSTLNNIVNTANRMAEYLRVADVRLKAHKTPLIGETTKEQQGMVANLYYTIDENVPVVLKDEKTQMPLELFKNDVAYLNDKLIDTTKELLAQFMQMHGINTNPEMGKKERLLTDEVNSNNEYIQHARETFLRPRQEFCEEVKRKFNIDIYYEYTADENTGGNYDDFKRNTTSYSTKEPNKL